MRDPLGSAASRRLREGCSGALDVAPASSRASGWPWAWRRARAIRPPKAKRPADAGSAGRFGRALPGSSGAFGREWWAVLGSNQ